MRQTATVGNFLRDYDDYDTCLGGKCFVFLAPQAAHNWSCEEWWQEREGDGCGWWVM